MERTLRPVYNRDRGPASAPNAVPGFGRLIEPCGRSGDRQRLYFFVRGPALPDRAARGERRYERAASAHRAASERRTEGSLPRAVSGDRRVRSQGAIGQAGVVPQTSAQRSQCWRQESLDGGLLRSPQTGTLASHTNRQWQELRGGHCLTRIRQGARALHEEEGGCLE